MKYNQYGNTGLLVSELCFGTMTFGGEGAWKAMGSLQADESRALVKAAVDAGINFFDTANVYSEGSSERLLGQAIRDLGLNRHELVLATKVMGAVGPGPNQSGLSRTHIFHEVDKSLVRLGTEHIDILYLHGFDPLTPIFETVRTLHELVVSGKVRHVAVCNWPAWAVMKARGLATHRDWHGFEGLQYYYSLATRDIEREILPLAQEEHLAVLPWSPLAGGFLTGKYRAGASSGGARRDNFDFPVIDKEKTLKIVEELDTIAKDHGVSIAQVALGWVRTQPGVTSTIIGARTPEQLAQNIASIDVVLSPEDQTRLDQRSALAPEFPGWMLAFQTQDRWKLLNRK